MFASSSAQHLGTFLKRMIKCSWLYCYNFFFLFRYFVKVTAPHTATLQVQTSNSDVLIKLQVLDNEKEVTSVIGKGNAVIPVFNFWSNQSLLSTQCKYCMPYLMILFTAGYTFFRYNHRKYYFSLLFSLTFNFTVQNQEVQLNEVHNS